MPTYSNGNLWDYYEQGYFVVVTTNIGWKKDDGCAVMGAGIAKEASERFPDLAKRYGEFCQRNGAVTPVKSLKTLRLVLFPTKGLNVEKPWSSWRSSSSLELIERSCQQLQSIISSSPDIKIAIGWPGCGNGKLQKEQVQPLLDQYFNEQVVVVGEKPKEKELLACLPYKRNLLQIFPLVFSELSGNALAVYLYMAHHYCLTDNATIKLTYKEITNGTMMDAGLRLSQTTIRSCIKELEKKKLLKVTEQEYIDPNSGNRYTPHYYKVYATNQNKDFQILSKIEVAFHRSNFEPRGQCDNEPQSSSSLLPTSVGEEEEDQVEKEEEKKNEIIQSTTVTNIQVNKKPSRLHPLLTLTAKTSEMVALDPAQEIAQELWIKLGDKRKRDKTSKLSLWVKRIRDFLSTDPPIDIEYVRKVLRWYLKNIGKLYVPEVYSADSFCGKFFNIESKMIAQLRDSDEERMVWNEPKELTQEQKQQQEELRNRAMFDKI